MPRNHVLTRKEVEDGFEAEVLQTFFLPGPTCQVATAQAVALKRPQNTRRDKLKLTANELYKGFQNRYGSTQIKTFEENAARMSEMTFSL